MDKVCFPENYWLDNQNKSMKLNEMNYIKWRLFGYEVWLVLINLEDWFWYEPDLSPLKHWNIVLIMTIPLLGLWGWCSLFLILAPVPISKMYKKIVPHPLLYFNLPNVNKHVWMYNVHTNPYQLTSQLIEFPANSVFKLYCLFIMSFLCLNDVGEQYSELHWAVRER